MHKKICMRKKHIPLYKHMSIYMYVHMYAFINLNIFSARISSSVLSVSPEIELLVNIELVQLFFTGKRRLYIDLAGSEMETLIALRKFSFRLNLSRGMCRFHFVSMIKMLTPPIDGPM